MQRHTRVSGAWKWEFHSNLYCRLKADNCAFIHGSSRYQDSTQSKEGNEQQWEFILKLQKHEYKDQVLSSDLQGVSERKITVRELISKTYISGVFNSSSLLEAIW